jgi:hypothetical protein
MFGSRKAYTASDYMNTLWAEGSYCFMPQWNDSKPYQFSQLNPDIVYQKGNLLEQWTVQFMDNKT